MKKANLKWITILAVIFFTAISCQEEEILNDEEIGNTNFESFNSEEIESIILSPITNEVDIITKWNDLFLILDRYSTGMRPNATSRSIAYINLAAYETVVANQRGYNSMSNYLRGFDINNSRNDINNYIALNTCYALVNDHFMYNLPEEVDAQIEVLKASLEEELFEGVDDSTIENSINWGTTVAEEVIAYSQTDTEAETQILDPQPSSYEPPVGDGFWTYSAEPERALFPYWSQVRTFVISSDETSSVPPTDAYSTNQNSGYYAQMLEVYESNNTAKAENNEDLWIAEFWSDDVEGLMISPPGRQIAIANQLIEQQNMSMEEALGMMLKLGFSLNDAAVSTWADKYKYMVMRPSVYIKEFIDPDFETNLFKFVYWPNPSFPGYPSGHSTFASAAAGVFIDYFGNNTRFTDRTHEDRTDFLGAPRTYNTLSEMAEENAFSRIPLGVHIRMDCTEGLRLGYEIADAVNELNLGSRR